MAQIYSKGISGDRTNQMIRLDTISQVIICYTKDYYENRQIPEHFIEIHLNTCGFDNCRYQERHKCQKSNNERTFESVESPDVISEKEITSVSCEIIQYSSRTISANSFING